MGNIVQIGRDVGQTNYRTIISFLYEDYHIVDHYE
jgi:hypothetical protein